MKKILLSLLLIVSITGVLSANNNNNNNILFNDVKGVELTYSEMASIEGDGWKNGIALSGTYIKSTIIALVSIFIIYPEILPTIGITVISTSPLSFSIAGGTVIAWAIGAGATFTIGMLIDDVRYPIYRKLGYEFLDKWF